jgi:hypothetical protein
MHVSSANDFVADVTGKALGVREFAVPSRAGVRCASPD